MIRLFAARDFLLIEKNGTYFRPAANIRFDAFFTSEDPVAYAEVLMSEARPVAPLDPGDLRVPLENQEVWAAGVTYSRSKDARQEESKKAGGGSFYDRVYGADRPELFFKATAHRVAGPGGGVRIRRDSEWNVPEPELTLAINAHGRIFGFTIGNDMSSRDIEGENPLYLPQAKVYDRSAALGPCLVLMPPPPPETLITLEVLRNGEIVFTGTTEFGRLKRTPESLAEWLFKEDKFPFGCYLMTGTGIVPPDSFSLRSGDEIRIGIEPVGTLVNTVM